MKRLISQYVYLLDIVFDYFFFVFSGVFVLSYWLMHRPPQLRTIRFILLKGFWLLLLYLHAKALIVVVFSELQNLLAVNANGVIVVDGAQPDKKAVARRPAQKKASIKPKPEEIIEISPDTEEVAEKEKPLNKEKAEEKSSKKKAPTLTSTLTARSKVDIISALRLNLMILSGI